MRLRILCGVFIGLTLGATGSCGMSAATQRTFTSVSAGFTHTCAVTPEGAAYCWGTSYVLGDGSTLPSNMDPRSVFLPHGKPGPVPVAGDLHFIAVNAGRFLTCGVTSTEAAYCWGSNGEGEVGDGALRDVNNWADVPLAVAGGLTFREVSPGTDHTCGVTRDSTAYCWGRAAFGMLGLGERPGPQHTRPAPVVGGLRFVTVSTGDYHACGLRADGAAYCWGLNERGQVGDGTDLEDAEGRWSPVPVTGGLRFTAVSAGGNHTCGLAADSAAYCWGSNGAGQLGDGTTTDHPSPVRVAGGLSFIAVSAGGAHTCALTATGAAYCWGSNHLPAEHSGQLGDGSGNDRSVPVPVTGGLSFKTVSAGGLHTCGLTATGDAYCWGLNREGQLGDGTTKSRSRPVRVAR